jgi:hypothetical protein
MIRRPNPGLLANSIATSFEHSRVVQSQIERVAGFSSMAATVVAAYWRRFVRISHVVQKNARRRLRRYFVSRARAPKLIPCDVIYLILAAAWLLTAIIVSPALACLKGFHRVTASAWSILRWTAQPRHALTVLLLLSMFNGSTIAAPLTIIDTATQWHSGSLTGCTRIVWRCFSACKARARAAG